MKVRCRGSFGVDAIRILCVGRVLGVWREGEFRDKIGEGMWSGVFF